MKTDLTFRAEENNPVLIWAKQSENPFLAMGHVGTHIDTYLKKNIPSDYTVSRGMVFSCLDKTEITLSDIDVDAIKKGDFVLLYTGWIEKYAYGSKEYFYEHPYCSDELIYALLAKEIHFIGIDCPGIKRHAEHEKFDRICEEKKVYVVENLVNLKKIPVFTQIEISWKNDEILTGLPCTVYANYENADSGIA